MPENQGKPHAGKTEGRNLLGFSAYAQPGFLIIPHGLGKLLGCMRMMRGAGCVPCAWKTLTMWKRDAGPVGMQVLEKGEVSAWTLETWHDYGERVV